VATCRGAVPEVVGDAGVLIDPEDERALTGALQRVLTGDVDRAALRRASLARATEFTAERTAGRVVDLLLATAGARPVLERRAG
jgi:glycosyltransferase involved in cell wall biosynthesis